MGKGRGMEESARLCTPDAVVGLLTWLPMLFSVRNAMCGVRPTPVLASPCAYTGQYTADAD